VWIGIDRDAHWLTDPNMLQLALLEIGDNPDVGDWHEIEQRHSRSHKPANPHLTIADNAADGSFYNRIIEVDLSQSPRGFGLRKRRFRSFSLGGENIQLLALHLDSGSRRPNGGICLRAGSLSLLQLSPADDIRPNQRTISFEFAGEEFLRGPRGVELRLALGARR